MAKALGSEIKKFYEELNSSFILPKGKVFHEAEDYDDPEIHELNDTTKYDLSKLGFFYYADEEDSTIMFSRALSLWQKTQTHIDLLITISKEDECKIRQLLIDNGVKINK